MAELHYRRTGKSWFVSDGFIWDDLPADFRPDSGRPLECSSKLMIFNPQARPAKVVVRFFHTDREATEVRLSVRPGRIETIELATLEQVPHKQSFWITIESNVPVLPQACHEDYTFWDQTPDSLVAVAPYPGPLRDERSWLFPDCYQGGPKSWHEQETVAILNPGARAVTCELSYFLRGRKGVGHEQVTIAPRRVAQIDVWKRRPRVLGSDDHTALHIEGDYALQIDASGPVIAQNTRRARWRGRPSVIGSRSVMGLPLRGSAGKLWYYPGGAIIDSGVLPRGQNFDVTWNLLFMHNLDARKAVTAKVTFHHPDGPATQSRPITIRPRQSDLQWLHLEPWLGKHTRYDEPFAMTVRADGPVVPDVTGAEFEMWSQMCPGAMSAVNFCPGPLRDEKLWWLGIGQAGGDDETPTDWLQTYHLFNPTRKPVRVTLSLLGLASRRRFERAVDLAPGAVAWVHADQFARLPVGEPFAVCAAGDGAFCAQVFVRARTRGLRPTRAMYSMMGVPMKLTTGGR